MDLNREFPASRKNPPVAEWAGAERRYWVGIAAVSSAPGGTWVWSGQYCSEVGTALATLESFDWMKLARSIRVIIEIVADVIREVAEYRGVGQAGIPSLTESGAFPGLDVFALQEGLIVDPVSKIQPSNGLPTAIPMGGGQSKAQIAADYHAVAAIRRRGECGAVRADGSPRNQPVARCLDWQRGLAASYLVDRTTVSKIHLELQDFRLGAGISEGAGVVVAVLDTGFSTMHADKFDSRIEAFDCTGESRSGRDGNGHGTFCLSEIGANGLQGGPTGGARGAKLVSIKVLHDAGWGTDSEIAAGINLARKLAVDVISMSLGGPDPMPESEAELKLAVEEGIVIVAAAGNDGARSDGVGYPAHYKECHAIAACDGDKNIASFSNYGPQVSLTAVGVQVLGWSGVGGASFWSGTSMATPFAAALAACMLGTSPRQRNADRVELFGLDAEGSTVDIDRSGRDIASGAGLIQCYAAQEMFRVVPLPPTPPAEDWSKELAKVVAIVLAKHDEVRGFLLLMQKSLLEPHAE